MKKHLLTFLLGLLPIVAVLAQDIPNPGFEDWQDYSLFEEPVGYSTTNSQAYFLGGKTHITQVAGRSAGSSAMRLEVDESAFFGVVPIAFILNLSNPLAGGHPLGTSPDSLVGHFRYQLSAQDTFSLIAIFKFQGLPLGFAQINLTGTSNGYERVSIPTGPFVFPPDSVAFAMGIGVLGGVPTIGDFVEVDDITLHNSRVQLPNNEFDEWELISFREPVGWGSANLFTAIGRNNVESVSRSEESYAGNYAARIESVEYEFFGFRDTSGLLITGDVSSGVEGFPCDMIPEAFHFKYRYEPVGDPNEMAIASVAVYGQGIELGSFYQQLAPSATYADASMFFPPIAGNPDTCVIGFAVGVTDTLLNTSKPGSVLYVDELVFGPGVSTRDLPKQQVTDLVYPNPATEYLWIKKDVLEGAVQRIDIVSLDGRWVRSIQNDAPGVYVGDLNIGYYTIRVVTDTGEYLTKFEKH